MKKLLFITAVIGMFAFASCDNTVKPGPGPGTDPIETTLTVSTIPNNVPVGGGKATFTITSNTDWTITKTDTWFSLNETNGNGDATIEVDVDANDGQQRSSTITVKTDDGQQTKTVMLTQLGKAAPNISVNNPAEVSPDGGSVTFTITANTNWTITQPTEDWLEITSALSGEGNATVTVRVENNDGSRRQSIIDVVGGPDDAIERSVTLTQKSRPRPVTIEELEGTYGVGEWLLIYDSSTGEDSQEILYTDKIKIARVGESETDLVISDFYKTYLENYPGFSVNATFDATAQKIFIEAQKVEPSLFAAANVETWLIPDVVETAPGSGELEMFGPSQGAISYDGDVVMISLRTHPGDTQNYISFQLCPVEISTGQIGHYIFWSWETDWEKLADEQVDAPTLAPVKHAPSPKYIYSPGKSYKQAYTRR